MFYIICLKDLHEHIMMNSLLLKKLQDLRSEELEVLEWKRSSLWVQSPQFRTCHCGLFLNATSTDLLCSIFSYNSCTCAISIMNVYSYDPCSCLWLQMPYRSLEKYTWKASLLYECAYVLSSCCSRGSCTDTLGDCRHVGFSPYLNLLRFDFKIII